MANWFDSPGKPSIKTSTKADIPDGLWAKCDNCNEVFYQKVIEENLWTCPECKFHFRISSRQYMSFLLDEGKFTKEIGRTLIPKDPLEFIDTQPYPKRIGDMQKKTGINEACIAGEGSISGHPVIMSLLDFSCIGGSMGSVVGEKVARVFKRGIQNRCPVITVNASGGARMQEGILSLMQMAKTSAIAGVFAREGLIYISIFTDPTMAGVMASYASLGDIIISEPNALAGFAGPRVIKQTIREELPVGFQRAEFLQKHGFIDIISSRKNLRELLVKILSYVSIQ
ncbi:MAG: acetyl-CoA carboxylase carboxyltransferase subunit beta [Candidatus Coatesbacteria bacterium]|nr:acetyl-CoA carboxylase carboxyltransferase subunit beta [Candidatus Coatesbacteria bacterium]